MTTAIREKAIQGIEKGDVFTVVRRFSTVDVNRFAHISKDDNPVHFSEAFAAAKGFDHTVCHGLLVGSMLTEIGGQIGWLATGMSFRFKKPVYPGEKITCRLTILDVGPDGKALASADMTNESGEIVITAELFGYIPVGDSRKSLAKIKPK